MHAEEKSWLYLYQVGKFEECSLTLKKIMNRQIIKGEKNDSTLQYLNNNLFVCDQLAVNWEIESKDDRLAKWTKAFERICDLHGCLRCQHLLRNAPTQLFLCVTYNALWWTIMRMDFSCLYACYYDEALKISSFSLKNVLNKMGDYQLGPECATHTEDVLRIASRVIPHILHQSAEDCQFIVDILLLSVLLVLGCYSSHDDLKVSTITSECLEIVNKLFSIIPQINIHILSDLQDKKHQTHPNLLKFGLSNVNSSVSAENREGNIKASCSLIRLISALCCIKRHKYEKALSFLKLSSSENLPFTYLLNYFKALISLELSKPDDCLYYFSLTSVHKATPFMQAHALILQGRALLAKEKSSEALEILRNIHFKIDDLQLPVNAFLISEAFKGLGDTIQQIEMLDVLCKCLSADAASPSADIIPTNGLEQKLLLALHPYIEISYPEALYTSAIARLTLQPKEAAEQLLDLLFILENETVKNPQSREKIVKIPPMPDLLHEAATALIESNCAHEAQLLCEAALEHHRLGRKSASSKDNVLSRLLSSLDEDVIALMLLAEVQASEESPELYNSLNKSAILLQDVFESSKTKISNEKKEDHRLSSALLARVFLQKALFNAKRNFRNDAIACFQRALTYNQGDCDAMLQYASHLFDWNQTEDSLDFWSVYQGLESKAIPWQDSTIQHLLRDSMSPSKKELTLKNFQSFSER